MPTLHIASDVRRPRAGKSRNALFLTNPYEKSSWPAGHEISKLGRNVFDYCTQHTSERVALSLNGEEIK